MNNFIWGGLIAYVVWFIGTVITQYFEPWRKPCAWTLMEAVLFVWVGAIIGGLI